MGDPTYQLEYNGICLNVHHFVLIPLDMPLFVG